MQTLIPLRCRIKKKKKKERHKAIPYRKWVHFSFYQKLVHLHENHMTRAVTQTNVYFRFSLNGKKLKTHFRKHLPGKCVCARSCLQFAPCLLSHMQLCQSVTRASWLVLLSGLAKSVRGTMDTRGKQTCKLLSRQSISSKINRICTSHLVSPSVSDTYRRSLP